MSQKTGKSRDITGLVRPAVRALAAYHIDETPVRVKLDAMENPFPLPGKVRTAIAAALRKARLNLYPDPSAKDLKRAIGKYWGIKPERMLLGNGSDELIQAVLLAFGGPVVVPAPTFAMYEITARALSQDVVRVPLGPDFSLDADGVIAAARRSKARVIFLASPNNPTGNRFSDEAVQRVLDETGAAVVIDEAYYSFSGGTWLPRLDRHRNMIVLRTLSKIGFAGLRVGVLAASPDVIAELNKVRLPYNINALSQAAAVAALAFPRIIDGQIERLIAERGKLYRELLKLPGATPFPSETNFLLLWFEDNATAVYRALKKRGILVKNLDAPGPLQGCLRITIGTPAENRELLAALRSILAPGWRK